jgi:hypothetical protein
MAFRSLALLFFHLDFHIDVLPRSKRFLYEGPYVLIFDATSLSLTQCLMQSLADTRAHKLDKDPNTNPHATSNESVGY